MKGLIFLFLILTAAGSSYANTLIVSDIDDTIKITNVLSKPKSMINAFLSRRAFSGMSELYQELNVPETTIYYVSGSPLFLKHKIENFLDFNDFPQAQNVILKNTSVSTYDYKVRAIRNLILKMNPDKIILIGDDTQFDPEVYDTVAKENTATVESIYIRVVKNRKLPENALIKDFFSSVEIAAFELLKGNIEALGLRKITTSFVKQSHSSKIAIRGRYCPESGREQLEELKLQMPDQSSIDSLELAQEKILKTCN
jgi:phosphatidate phosphatase APP1